MRTTRFLRYGAIAMATVGLSIGMAAASSATVDHTGPDSHLHLNQKQSNKVDVKNKNHVRVNNNNDQWAQTGSAKVKDNTEGGDATSGSAANDNSADTSVSLSNSSLCDCLGNLSSDPHDASISNTGPDSKAWINQSSKNELKVSNDNKVSVNNNNTQTAKSGNAEVSHNTSGGSATSGDATNSNTASTSVDISN
jgi:hypothetical protein